MKMIITEGIKKTRSLLKFIRGLIYDTKNFIHNLRVLTVQNLEHFDTWFLNILMVKREGFILIKQFIKARFLIEINNLKTPSM